MPHSESHLQVDGHALAGASRHHPGPPRHHGIQLLGGSCIAYRIATRALSFDQLWLLEEKLTSVDELKPFSQYASQKAALDYIVLVESDVFIPSYSGNMARAVEGHRHLLGHRKTITPDRQGFPHKRKGLISGTKSKESFLEVFYENPLTRLSMPAGISR